MPIQVYGGSKQYAFRYDPKLLVDRDVLIIARRNRMDGIGRSLCLNDSAQMSRSLWTRNALHVRTTRQLRMHV